jgi:hypothetical protein
MGTEGQADLPRVKLNKEQMLAVQVHRAINNPENGCSGEQKFPGSLAKWGVRISPHLGMSKGNTAEKNRALRSLAPFGGVEPAIGRGSGSSRVLLVKMVEDWTFFLSRRLFGVSRNASHCGMRRLPTSFPQTEPAPLPAKFSDWLGYFRMVSIGLRDWHGCDKAAGGALTR